MAEVETSKDAPATAEVEAQNEPQEETKPVPTEPEPEVETMRCVRLNGHGGYGKLKVEKQPKPKATDGHVVVKVHACGLNFADLMQRQGSYSETPKLPFTPGLECSGVVEEIGEHVTGIEVGSRVCCIAPFGAWAEYIAVPFTSCFIMPESMTFEEGAAFPVTYLTSYLMLFHCGNIKKRKSVLIHMAAGGVGTAATQLCKTVEGVTIFGTASASKHERIKEFGVDHPIDYRTQDYVQAIKEITHGVDLILEPLSGSDTKKCYDLLNPMGAMICFGSANQITESKGMFSAAKNWFQGVTFNPSKMIADNKTVSGFHLGRMFGSTELIQDAMKELMKLYSDGALKPCIDRVFALEEVAKAQQKMHERKNIGKIILSLLKEPEPEPEPEPKKKKKSGSKLEAEQKPKDDAEEAKPDAKEGEKEEPKPEEPKQEETKEEEPKKEQQETTKEEPAQPKEEEKTSEPPAPAPAPAAAPAAQEPAKEEPAEPAAAAEPSSDEVKEETKEEEAKKEDDKKEEDKKEEDKKEDDKKEEDKKEDDKKEETAEPAHSTESEAKQDDPTEQNTEM